VVAALVGGVAIVTVPITDVAADPPRPPVVQRAPSIAERVGPPVTTFQAPTTKAAPAPKAGPDKKRDARRAGKDAPADSGDQGLLPSVDSLVPALERPVPVPTVPLPSVPPLPIEPPALPSLPPPPDLGLTG
jgi:hypothetical protein